MGLPWSPAPIVPVPARWGTGVLSRGRLARFPLRCFLGRPSRGSLGGLGSPDAQTVGPSVAGASAGGAGRDVGPGLLSRRLVALVWRPPQVAGLRLGHLVCGSEPSVYHQRMRVP